jgi:sRNA-binding regulator protein Hfq
MINNYRSELRHKERNMDATQENIRAEQQAMGRKLEAVEQSTAGRTETRRHAPPVRAQRHDTPKGHEAFLKALEQSCAVVSFEKIGSGEVFSGTVKHSDKFTVSVQIEDCVRVIFKHDISEFSTIARTGKAS